MVVEREEQQDEEAEERFADESPAKEPGPEVVPGDPDEGPEQPTDEA